MKMVIDIIMRNRALEHGQNLALDILIRHFPIGKDKFFKKLSHKLIFMSPRKSWRDTKKLLSSKKNLRW